MRRRQANPSDSERLEQDDDLFMSYGRPSVSAWIAAAAVAFAFFLLGGFIKTYRQLEGLREESRREISELRDSMRRLQNNSSSGGGATGRIGARVAAMPPASRRERPQAPAQQSAPPQPSAPQLPVEQAPESVVPPAERPVRQAEAQPIRQPEQRAAVPDFSETLQPTPSSSMTTVAVSAREPARAPVVAAQPDPDLLEEAMRYEYEENLPKRPRYQVGRKGDGDTGQLLTATGDQCQVVSVSAVQKRLIVEGGRNLRLGAGERLELCRDGRWIADLRVLDVFDYQSSCEVLHATLAPEPGDTVRRAPAR